MIPSLQDAEFFRYGAVHRNTFINAPALLTPTLELKSEPGLYFAGQIAGTEGYVESAALGSLAARFVAARLGGKEPSLPPETTAHGGLLAHLPPLAGITRKLDKRTRYEAIAQRALADLDAFIARAEVAA